MGQVSRLSSPIAFRICPPEASELDKSLEQLAERVQDENDRSIVPLSFGAESKTSIRA